MESEASVRVVDLRCDWLTNPIGTDNREPRLSWRLEDGRPAAEQTAYQVQVYADGPRGPEKQRLLWDTGRRASANCVGVRYEGPPLASRTRYLWRVRVWDATRRASPWSDPAFWETGLLDASEWVGRWIGLRQEPSASVPCPFLRRRFRLPSGIVRARLYATARGLFEAHLNGKRVGEDCFVPGWSDYHKRIDVLCYDVTDLVCEGENVLGFILGEGWYSGYLLWYGEKNHYGDTPSLLAQLMVELEDGRTETVATDGSWKVATGPLLASDIYHGETYDARREFSGWDRSGFDDAEWRPVDLFEAPAAVLCARPTPAVRAVEELVPRSVSEPSPGTFVFDLGQNMVGRVRLRLRAEPGTEVVLRFAEMLNPDGTLYTANLRRARATDRYIARGGDEEVYEPRFTYHGFRYVEVRGLGEAPELRGIVLHSAMEPSGGFRCSDALLNQLHRNIVWGQRGNFLELPTDCPQRDERLGWTGDAQVFMPTACFNFDVASFFAKWLRDLEDAQSPEGAFPHVAPDVLTPTMRRLQGTSFEGGCAAWADAGVICPWVHYLYYGDPSILEARYQSMKKWIAYQERTSRDLIRPAEGFGDWLDPDVVRPGIAPTPRDLIGTAYFAHTAGIMAKVARVLRLGDDARAFAALRARVVRAFRREFVTAAGRVVGDTQTGYLLALAFDLLPEAAREPAFAQLVRLLESRRRHLATGFVGTPLLLPVLTRFGRLDIAYDVLFQKDYPGWLYPVVNGATTMWERWNSWTKESGFGDPSMNSFNHYAYGAVGVWMYAVIGGIALDEEYPGFRRFTVAPLPEPRLSEAECWHRSPYGEICTHWQDREGRFRLDLRVPPGSSATVRLPANGEALREGTVTVNGKQASEAFGVVQAGVEDGRPFLRVVAGSYCIECPHS